MLCGNQDTSEVKDKIAEQTADMKNVEPKNLEEQTIKLIGPDIYEKLIKGYWKTIGTRSATDLPPYHQTTSVRLTFDNDYFNDRAKEFQSVLQRHHQKICWVM